MKDKKNIVILLLSTLSLISIYQHGGYVFVRVMVSVLFVGGLDFLISKLFYKRTIVPKSAVISGFIIAGILSFQVEWWWLFLFLSLAIISKHLIRYNKRHILNPANFGLLIAAILGFPLTWQIESNIYVIIIVGAYLAYSLKKSPHVLGFLLFFVGIFYFAEISPLLLISWFFVFIMLIEPKTSGFGNIRGFVFGGLVGVSSYLIYSFVPQIDLFVGSLLVANLFNPLLDKLRR
ncbi:MAG: RnfABCDGE type electron transport complex subunit D [Candidatus Saganbacteria bacterium]|nr:RnfABCDGE type electron transport complex subunit D [Candidatus Saganbacteria bacterium]